MNEKQDIEITSYKAVAITVDCGFVKAIGWRKAIWGLDIFVNGTPILKTIIAANIAANILVWIIFWLAR